jgi:hypothetical protein
MTDIRITDPERVLFVDDMPGRYAALLGNGVIACSRHRLVTDALAGIGAIELGEASVVFLDHDLETFVHDPYPREITGQDVARAIVSLSEDMRPKLVIVHSMNDVGAERIVDILRKGDVECVRIPVSTLMGD